MAFTTIRLHIPKFMALLMGFALLIYPSNVLADPQISEYALSSGFTAQDIVNGPDGNLWFSDPQGEVIGKITTSGAVTTYTAELAGGLTVGSDGAIYFVNQYQNKIGKISVAGVVTEYDLPGPSSTEHDGAGIGNAPTSMTLGPDGNIWFAGVNQGDAMLGSITPSGNITFHNVNVPKLSNETSTTLNSLTLGPDGNLWFTSGTVLFPQIELGSSLIGYYNPVTTDSAVVTSLPSPSGPISIITGSDNNLWFTDANNNQIDKMTTTGNLTTYTVPTPDSAVLAITSGSDGAIWFTEYSGNKVGRVSTSGDFKEYNLLKAHSQPYGIASGPDGNIWFTEASSPSKIGKVAPVGSVDAPVNLSATTPTRTAPVIGWSSVVNAASYNIYRDGIKIGSTTAKSYTDTGAQANTTHTYYVVAVSANNISSANSASITVTYDTIAPMLSSPAVSSQLLLLPGAETISATSSDNLSGVIGGEYFVTTTNTQPSGTVGTGRPMTLSSGKLSATYNSSGTGIHYVWMRAKDAAGNWSGFVQKSYAEII